MESGCDGLSGSDGGRAYLEDLGPGNMSLSCALFMAAGSPSFLSLSLSLFISLSLSLPLCFVFVGTLCTQVLMFYV